MLKDHRKQGPCTNCPDLLEVIQDVLSTIQTETTAPLTITDSEHRHLLEQVALKLKAATRAHQNKAA